MMSKTDTPESVSGLDKICCMSLISQASKLTKLASYELACVFSIARKY